MLNKIILAIVKANKTKHRNYYVALISIFLLLIVIFSWNESFDITKKINDQKVSNFFLTVFTIAGTITAFYYSKMQYELSEKINKYSVKPEIFIDRVTFYIYEEIVKKLSSFTDTTIKYEYVKPLTKQKIILTNIGVGNIINLKVSWEFDENEVKRLVQGIYDVTYYQEEKVILSIKPNESKQIELPLHYISCCGPKVIEKIDPVNRFCGLGIPSLFLNLSFFDLQDSVYIYRFRTIVIYTPPNQVDLSFHRTESTSFLK